ncbi:MAG: hypothetical protein QNK35_18320 [Bacteroides sp.]|nr:hypothetical protein [Bacteroides sp.]
MGSLLRKYGFFILFQLTCLGGYAQGHLFSRVSVNHNAVYVGQPVEVTVSVYTSTWFTSGVEPGNIKVNGAFTIYFRSLSATERINGKTYAGVNMIFNVFPYDDEDIIFPSLDIRVETPDEGSSKGVRRLVKTEALTISVKPVPANYKEEDWMVSSSVSVKESWSGNRNNVLVGNVLERKIEREVQGSVAELIPPIHWDTVPGVSLYPSRADVRNNKTRTSISAIRTDAVQYLFEEEGEIEIPELVILWWNPQTSKMQKRTLPKVLISVGPNPDLGMLTTIRDSLSLMNAVLEEEVESKEKRSILGLSIWQFVLALILLILALYIMYRIYGPLKRAFKIQREAYLDSEIFYFRKFQKAARRKDPGLARQSLYRWIDQLHLQEPTLSFFVENYGSKVLLDSPESLFNRSEWSRARKNFLRGSLNTRRDSSPWINP